jgi:phage shock protein PspC (stress-responsive transcriptional regulator)
MTQIITVSLDNRAYQMSEDAFSALRRYLDRARAGLRNDPDVNEVLADFERSIAEKCAALLLTGKDVVGVEEMNRILEEMGPVGEGPESQAAGPEWTGAPSGAPRKLQKQPRGAKLSGVCMGLAEYFDIDPVFLRTGFVAASLFAGLGIFAYLLLEILMPWPSGHPERRYKVSFITLVIAGAIALYLFVNSGGSGRGMLGLRPQEILFVPIMIGLSFLPTLVLLVVASLLVVAAVKYLGLGAHRGK